MHKPLAFIKQRFMSDSLPLKNQVCSIFFLEAYLLAIVSAVAGTLQGKGVGTLVFHWGFVVLSTVLFCTGAFTKVKLHKPMLLFISFALVPFLFFRAAGFDGSMVLFAVLCIFVISFLFTGRIRVLLVVLSILEYVACILISYWFPVLVSPYSGTLGKVIDLTVVLVFCMSSLAVMTRFITKAYEQEHQNLEMLSKTDALTGAYNRRFLWEFLTRELESCAETGQSACVMMMDLDLFKDINDTYGHGFGDKVLRSFYQTARGALREYDVLVRYGGEEFAAVLHDIGMEQAKEIAERVRLAVSEMQLRSGVKITVSIGIAQSKPDDTVETILGRADAALYKVKETGRNSVLCEPS